MKSYFKPVLLIGEGGDGELIPPGQIGSVINEGGGDVEVGGNSKGAFENSVTDPLTATTTDAFTADAAETYVPSEFTPPIDE